MTYFDAANDLKQPSYEVYGASVKFIDDTEPFSLAAGVINLTNRVYIDSAESSYSSPIGYHAGEHCIVIGVLNEQRANRAKEL